MVVHVVRELRSKQAKAEKAQAKTGRYLPPKVSIKELKTIFPYLSDATAKMRLKDKCECIPVRVSCVNVGFTFTYVAVRHLCITSTSVQHSCTSMILSLPGTEEPL